MLAEFRAKGFKNFQNELIFKLDDIKSYEFNTAAVKNNIVNTGLIYGHNGSGKTNLGYALMDITLHLVDKNKKLNNYKPYINLNIDAPVAFYYRFVFDDMTVEYEYEKNVPENLIKESVKINGTLVVKYDYTKHEHVLKLKGAESLKTDLTTNEISFVKYIINNSILEQNKENEALIKMYKFVDSMLQFSSLESNEYQGFKNGSSTITSKIIEYDKVTDFQTFLEEAGIQYNLVVKEINGEEMLYCKFGEKEIPFFDIASRGTCTLTLFYHWLLQLNNVSFVFIDEFDAFYHHELADIVVKELYKLDNVQTFASTHNTDLMSNDILRPDCYYYLQDGKIISLANSTEKDLRKAHNLQKMYKAGKFNV